MTNSSLLNSHSIKYPEIAELSFKYLKEDMSWRLMAKVSKTDHLFVKILLMISDYPQLFLVFFRNGIYLN